MNYNVFKSAKQEVAQIAFLNSDDDLSPLLILANSKQYGKMDEEDKIKLDELYNKVSPSKEQFSYYFWTWAAVGATLYNLRFCSGRLAPLRLSLPFVLFGAPHVLQDITYKNGMKKHKGEIRSISQKYNWRNDDLAVGIVRKTLNLK